MRNSGKLVAVLVVVAALAFGPSVAMAAPVNQQATSHSSNPGLFAHFLQIMAGVWTGTIFGSDGAVWTGDGCRGGRC